MTGYTATFSKQADNGITCNITSVVDANYVDSTVLLSAVTMIQYLKNRTLRRNITGYVIKTAKQRYYSSVKTFELLGPTSDYQTLASDALVLKNSPY